MLCALKKSKHSESNEMGQANSKPQISKTDVLSIYSISLFLSHLKARFNGTVTRLGDLLPFGRLFKVLGNNLFGPNRPNFWRLFGRFLKVGQNLKFLCYKIIFKAVNFQKKYFLKYFEKKLGNFFSKKDPKYAFLATKTSKN